MHQPTARVIRILESIAKDRRGKRLSDLSCELDIPKSTLLPILQSLCEFGYLSQDEIGAYHAGVTLFSLGASLSGGFPTLDYVKKQLTSLVERFGETCYFGVLDGGFVLYLDKVDSTNPLRILVNTGRRLPAYSTGIGKALLMDKSEEELRLMYPDGLSQITPKTVADISALARELSKGRRLGYVQEIEESTEHVRCYGVPIKKRGVTVAAISMAVPTFRYDEAKGEAIRSALMDAAAQISETVERTDARLDNIF